MKILTAILAPVLVLLLATSAIASNASAVTAQDVKTEITATSFTNAVNNLQTADFKKHASVDQFKKTIQKQVAQITKALDKGKLNNALHLAKALIHRLSDRLTSSALSNIESTIPNTVGAVNAMSDKHHK